MTLGVPGRRGRGPRGAGSWPGPGARLRSGSGPEACRRWVHLWAWPRRLWVQPPLVETVGFHGNRSGAGTTSGSKGGSPGPRCGGVNPGEPPSRLPDLAVLEGWPPLPGRLQGWSRLRAPGQQAGPPAACRCLEMETSPGCGLGGDGGQPFSYLGDSKGSTCFSGSVCLCGPPLPRPRRGPPPPAPSVPHSSGGRSPSIRPRRESLLGPEQEG